ncbi:hypothetical protein ABEB36_002819 [Hypothenemus hampei]|uniref:Uncharacterized protein n=1 Tax=Hypothenemus hampei TaxID=57062 RepID=A0ABD1F739_HYPHA
MNNKKVEAIGDTRNNEEVLLQDRLTRVLSYISTERSETVYLYFNNQYSEDPPSNSLFDSDGDQLDDPISNETMKSKALHKIYPELVKSRIFDLQCNNSYQIEDVVTRVYFPSEEFVQVVEMSRFKSFCSRIWSCCKT